MSENTAAAAAAADPPWVALAHLTPAERACLAPDRRALVLDVLRFLHESPPPPAVAAYAALFHMTTATVAGDDDEIERLCDAVGRRGADDGAGGIAVVGDEDPLALVLAASAALFYASAPPDDDDNAAAPDDRGLRARLAGVWRAVRGTPYEDFDGALRSCGAVGAARLLLGAAAPADDDAGDRVRADADAEVWRARYRYASRRAPRRKQQRERLTEGSPKPRNKRGADRECLRRPVRFAARMVLAHRHRPPAVRGSDGAAAADPVVEPERSFLVDRILRAPERWNALRILRAAGPDAAAEFFAAAAVLTAETNDYLFERAVAARWYSLRRRHTQKDVDRMQRMGVHILLACRRPRGVVS